MSFLLEIFALVLLLSPSGLIFVKKNKCIYVFSLGLLVSTNHPEE